MHIYSVQTDKHGIDSILERLKLRRPTGYSQLELYTYQMLQVLFPHVNQHENFWQQTVEGTRTISHTGRPTLHTSEWLGCT